jgi:hypothetical protein
MPSLYISPARCGLCLGDSYIVGKTGVWTGPGLVMQPWERMTNLVERVVTWDERDAAAGTRAKHGPL